MRFGLDVAQQRMDWDEIVSRSRFAEELGFDGVWGFDHFQPLYGEGPGNCFEGMTTLAALAGLTERVRLGLLVTGITYRHPSVLAAEAVTIDHASHGRLELALGAAWFDPEHTALGIEFPPTSERFDRLEDAMEVITGLMTGEPVSFRGHGLHLEQARMLPVPVQRPHPPIWVGGMGPRRTLPIAAKWADVWHGFGSPASLQGASARIDQLAEAAGRDPATILRASSLSLSEPPDAIRRSIEDWQAAGYGYLVCGWPGEGRDTVAEVATGILPDYI
jgi:alkanesulfonate monooxygenase SsuD/methylene tetrahydromethanopterin reductase-like flavin-dependent oxidoreductase (luciferase family)